MNRKCHWFYHTILCGAALLASIVPSLAQEKSDTKSGVPETLVSTAPQHLLFGIDLGIERSLTPKFSLGTDPTTHLWLLEMPNIAISPMAKILFHGYCRHGDLRSSKGCGGLLLRCYSIRCALLRRRGSRIRIFTSYGENRTLVPRCRLRDQASHSLW